MSNSVIETHETTQLLNVDLDIYSKSDLQPLVTALGKKVFVFHAGRYKRTYKAVLELNRIAKSADSKILAFCALIQALPKPQRKLWDEAKIREFSLGIQVQLKPITFEITLDDRTIRAASEVNAALTSQSTRRLCKSSMHRSLRPTLCYHQPRSVPARLVYGLQKLIQCSMSWSPARFRAGEPAPVG